MTVRFYCDSTVQRLAKWLRFAGFDTFYRKELSLQKIDTLCQRERRVFITRNKKKDIRKLLCSIEILEHSNIYHQIEAILSKYKIDITKIATLCIECNVTLKPYNQPVNHLQGVPGHIKDVLFCPRCGKLFWKGTHYQNMLKVIGRAMQNAECRMQNY